MINRSRVDGTKPAGLMLSRKGYREDCGTSYYIWGYSSTGRAPALQAGGHGFDSHHLHQRTVSAAEIDETQEGNQSAEHDGGMTVRRLRQRFEKTRYTGN